MTLTDILDVADKMIKKYEKLIKSRVFSVANFVKFEFIISL